MRGEWFARTDITLYSLLVRAALLPCLLYPSNVHGAAEDDTSRGAGAGRSLEEFHDGEKLSISELVDLSLEELLNIRVTTATKLAQTTHEAPSVMSVVTSNQIATRGYNSVGEALEDIAGLDLLHDHYQYNLGVRAVSSGKRGWSRIAKVMIDGQPVSFRPTSENILSEELIPIDVVERIEIIRGPASALYGANAFLGVVNIITKKGKELRGGQITGRLESHGERMGGGGSFAAGGQAGGFDFLAAGSLLSPAAGGYQLVPVPGRTHSAAGEESTRRSTLPQSYFAKVAYQTERLGDISLDFSLQNVDRYAEFQDWGVLTHNNRLAFRNLYARAQYAKRLGSTWGLVASAAYAEGRPTGEERLDFDRDDSRWIEREIGFRGFDFAAETTLDFGDWSHYRAGVDFTSDRQDLQTFYTVYDDGRRFPHQDIEYGEKTFNNLGAYGQAVLYPFRPLDVSALLGLGITVGIRYDWHNIYGAVFNYRTGLVYAALDNFYIKLLYGTSFKAPSSSQLYSNFIITDGVVGNPDLDPERAKSLELAFDFSPIKHLSFTLNGYYSEILDKVEILLPYDIVPNESAQNIASINSLGLEAEAVFSIGGVHSFVNYSYQKSILEKRYVGYAPAEQDAPLYPTHMLKFGVTYQVPFVHLNLYAGGRYTGARGASEPNSSVWNPIDYREQHYALSDYFLLDVMISSHKLRLLPEAATDIRFKITNVLDTHYIYPGFKDYDIQGFRRKFTLLISQQF